MNKNKAFIIIGVAVAALLVVAYLVWLPSDTPAEEFDPSVYFDGEPVSQEDIESVLTEEELEEIDRIYNENEKRQECIDKYGTEKDPLGLSEDADPRLKDCLENVNPNNPTEI